MAELLAGTVRYTRRSLGSTCLSSPFVMSERANVRPRQPFSKDARLGSSSLCSITGRRRRRRRRKSVVPWEPVESHARLKRSSPAADFSPFSPPSRGDQRFRSRSKSIQFPSVTEGIDYNYNRSLQRGNGDLTGFD